MLQGILYETIAVDAAGATIRLLPESPVYKGHFPGYPITPGVCLVEIALELMEEMAGQAGHDEKGVLTAEDVAALQPLYADVILALKQVYDPEIPVNIYDLGLIYELNIDKDRKVSIVMTFTAPNCPMADEVLHEVEESVKRVPGVTGCSIELTFEPVWDRSMLSEEARVDLGLDYEEDEYGKLS